MLANRTGILLTKKIFLSKMIEAAIYDVLLYLLVNLAILLLNFYFFDLFFN